MIEKNEIKNIMNNKKLYVKKMLGNKPSESTMSLDIFEYVNHNINTGFRCNDALRRASVKVWKRR